MDAGNLLSGSLAFSMQRPSKDQSSATEQVCIK